MSDSTTTTTATAPATKADKAPDVDLAAFSIEWAKGDKSDAELQEAVRSIHVGRRTKAVGLATKAVLTTAPDKAGTFLDLVNELPAKSASRTKSEGLSDEVLGAIRAHVISAMEIGGIELREMALANGLTDDSPELKFLASIGEAMTKAATKANGSARPNQYKEGLVELLADGRVTAGQEVFGPNKAKGKITAEGKITSKGKTGSPSVTAQANVGTTASGKQASVNGWGFWQVKSGDELVDLGSLRKE